MGGLWACGNELASFILSQSRKSLGLLAFPNEDGSFALLMGGGDGVSGGGGGGGWTGWMVHQLCSLDVGQRDDDAYSVVPSSAMMGGVASTVLCVGER